MEFKVFLSTLRLKGNLAYEYSPLNNYQTDIDLYLVDNKYIVPSLQAVNIKNGELLTKKNNSWFDKRGNKVDSTSVKTWEEGVSWAKAGSLIDLDTEKLNFDLDHPVEIEVLPSYDGSVNLILNDDKNIPRLINSRFSVREKDTYEIVDRIGENDTNIYNSKTFDKDSSLYFLYELNPIITYLGYVKGTLSVGLYCFYFTYCDSDENESDFIAESGVIPVFIGTDSDPRSMDGGIKNQLTDKGIQLKLTNVDKSYNYLKVYYVRYFADYNLNRVYECKKIYRKIPINSNTLYLQITGYEESEDIDANILNITKFNPKSVLTLAQCKNMLFFGNIVKNTDNYKELTDIALRIVPLLNVVKNFDLLDDLYISNSGDFAYYNSLNIYNKTGYFNQEYYRFGVVFIYLNGTLSNVYNTLGGVLNLNNELDISGNIYSSNNENTILIRNYIKSDDLGWIKLPYFSELNPPYIFSGENVNSKGVCKLNYTEDYDDSTIFSVKFKIPENVSKHLKEELGIRGLFFVRLKCVPNIIALCYLLSMDELLQAPVLEAVEEGKKEHYTECFLSKEKILVHDHSSRLYKYTQEDTSNNSISKVAYAGICPDFFLNLPYFNLIFNGGKFRLLKISKENSELIRNERFFNEKQGTKYNVSEGFKKVTICSVTENVSTVAIRDKIYRLEIGETEEAYKFKYAEIDNSKYNQGSLNYTLINNATNLVRGMYSPYLAIYSDSGELQTGCLYNIYKDAAINTTLEFLDRMNSYEPFYSISDRITLSDDELEYTCWRGDCYINLYTHRMSRNFNDPSLPNNDEIIDIYAWNNYDVENSYKWAGISRSDVNAVQIGSWITFKIRSSMNYALRSVDHSYVSEEATMGSPRSFYPRSYLLQRGENKLPDSYLYNDAYRASLGFKCYFTIQDINYIKNTFSNRILYSSIAILDSFKNNYRESLSTYYRDYSLEYGSIQKLIGFEGYLLVIFEHAIGVAVINERILAGTGDGEPVFINTKNVLPEELTIISDTYGTLWGDSVVKSEMGYVYGVDTNAKKIWRVKGQQLEILSDFKVNKFLVNNISLGERELYPTVGIRNVKTHYNNNKKDIMFTFYDDIYKDEEKVWNLCYNEIVGLFITFYSWVPSYSANIDTKFFSFNRDTAKSLTLLSKCNYSILENSGVLVDSPICSITNETFNSPTLHYVTINKSQVINYTLKNEDGTTSIKTFVKDGNLNNNGLYEFPDIRFRIEEDHWGNNKLFTINENNELVLNEEVTIEDIQEAFTELKVILLYITPYLNTIGLSENTLFKTELIAITLDSIVNSTLTTDFYLHGLAGIFNVKENLYPTYWYGNYHPFEFEFVVNDKIAYLKIFSNLVILSNKAEPESFHFEVEGDNYDFSSDKRTMYFRLESTKQLYLKMGLDIVYDRKFTDVIADKYTYELYYRGNPTRRENGEGSVDSEEYTKYYNNYINGQGFDKVYPKDSLGLILLVKSSIFPLYYERIDKYNDIYHSYLEMRREGYDFLNLSGSEIIWNRDLNLFNVVTHIKNSPIDLVGRVRGNSRYKEGRWVVLIPSIIFMLKNEDWGEPKDPFELNIDLLGDSTLELSNSVRKISLPPIIINSLYVPKEIIKNPITLDTLPNIYINNNYNLSSISLEKWTNRKETRIRDKWIKIRIRYSGKNLAIIHSIATLYNISYS